MTWAIVSMQQDPNYGINWPAFTMQVYNLINPAIIPVKDKSKKINYKNKPLRKDLILYLTQKMGVNLKAHGKEANFLDGRIVFSFR
jgi:hypothetical protein